MYCIQCDMGVVACLLRTHSLEVSIIQSSIVTLLISVIIYLSNNLHLSNKRVKLRSFSLIERVKLWSFSLIDLQQ